MKTKRVVALLMVLAMVFSFMAMSASAATTEIQPRISCSMGIFQMNMFVDMQTLERDKQLQGAMLAIRKKYGANALFKGMNLLKGATTLERNQQIGGHRA